MCSRQEGSRLLRAVRWWREAVSHARQMQGNWRELQDLVVAGTHECDKEGMVRGAQAD